MPRVKKKKASLKQKALVASYIKNNFNKTKTGLEVYNTNNRNSAHAIVSYELQKPTVQEELKRALKSSNLDIKKISENIANLANAKAYKVSGDTVLKANVEALKALGGYPTLKTEHKQYTLKAELSKKDLEELLESHRKSRETIDELLAD